MAGLLYFGGMTVSALIECETREGWGAMKSLHAMILYLLE